jgi:AcrR family transcriptional regulator
MPRQVDHEGRRRRIAQAVFGLISERGIEGASIRDAAQWAGVSVGAVQRCFSTKEEMIVFVLEYMNQRVTERVQAKISDAADPESVLTMLEQTLIGIVPVDEEGLAETRVWLAFTAQAAIDPKLAAVQRDQYAGLAELFTLLIRVAQEHGRVRPDIDAEQEAESLITFTDGLNVQILIGRHTPDAALAALEQRFSALRAG